MGDRRPTLSWTLLIKLGFGFLRLAIDQTPIRAEDLTELAEWLRVTRRDHDPSLA